MPWAGDMGRRGIPTAGVDRVNWLQFVVDVVIDGHDPGTLDARYGWPHGTSQGVLREALGRLQRIGLKRCHSAAAPKPAESMVPKRGFEPRATDYESVVVLNWAIAEILTS
jgi:hypothetical protein